MFIDNHKMSQKLQLFSSDCWCVLRVSHITSIKVAVFLALPPNHSKHDFHLLILSSACLGADTQFIWSELVSLHLLGSIAALWHQIDQRVAGLSQLADGHASSLSDELSHRLQLCWSNVDKLPSVIDHTCGTHQRVLDQRIQLSI